ncbi:cyclohexanecarboxyl-CoA dehydrogenase [Paenirhodobacter hankyongi]|uniref:Cyclohexanecarboxyl-CoA dehydrogenase n=1 Tax=Paenirhodobacter hankyongi TaxID=2294033 RepID=A0A421BJF9_9RHOB|nr:cyclohexanecarboxyl-CoA dehydrogenase [Sinirhodobacter hankyongi]RLL61569.1 cyclohexanecarboxyl-CoA dehydrogenase [Sinirhodobacter hankyongi]
MYPTIFDTEELTALREMARKFASEKLAPGYKAREKAGAFGHDILREMGSLGLIAPELPEELGGLGAGSIYSGVIIEEIARADFNMGYINILASLNGQILARFGNGEIKRDWLPKLTAGELMVAIALTEPRGGSDAANLGLKMERVGDHYVLNGEKTSISAADQAKGAVVFARTGQPEDRARGISAIFVPMDTPGISTTRFSDLGQHAIGRGSIFFDNVRVPAANLLGEEGKGFVQVMQGFDFSRSLIGLQCLGTARQSLDEAWAYIGERHAFGKPLAAFQGITHQLADFDTKVEAARLMCLNALWLKDTGRPHVAEAAMAKWWPPLLAYEAIHACLLIHGHAAYSDELPFEQRLRDVLGLQIGDGTAHIMKNIIARERAGRAAVAG